MKKNGNIGILIVVLLALTALGSCKKNKVDDKTKNEIESNIQDGTWRISYFNDSGDDETSNFVGYNFTFGSGTVSATNGSTNVTGTWSVTDSNSNDDNPSDMHFNLLFSGNGNFEDLNDDWEIISQTSTSIELKDVSGGNGGTDYLTFVKN